MKKTVFVPVNIRVPTPWDRHPKSLARALIQVSPLGPRMRCRYSSAWLLVGLTMTLDCSSWRIRWLRAATYRGCVPPCQRLYGDGRGQGRRLYCEFSTGLSRSGSMMAGVGVEVGCRIHWAGVMGTGLGGGLSCVRFAGTMVTLGRNAGGVNIGTLRDGAGQSVWSAPTGVSHGDFDFDRT